MISTHRSIYHGDVLEQLNYMDSQTVDVIITSPPYWSLRDYGVDEQIGLEDDYHDYLKIMHKVMKQLKRVLKDTGTCWVNLGDTYAGSGKGAGSNGKSKESFNHKKRPKVVNELQSKSLHGIPQRFFVNCIDDGWIARNYIIWYKPNAMPNSVKDRFTVKYEPVMFFSKSQKYYFDLDAVRVKPLAPTIPCSTQGKNPGDMWTINPRPFKESHYAVFPIDLPLQILKCACPPDGIVLDPFFGAGTTGVAAEKLGRKWCGIDINKDYIQIARKRLDKYKNHSLAVS